MARDQPSIHERGHGRWPGILAALGVPSAILNTGKHHPCPWCGGKDRFRFTDKDGDGRFYCGQCNSHGPVDYLMHKCGWDFARAAKEIESVLGEVSFKPARSRSSDPQIRNAMQRLWESCSLIKPGDFVDRYLGSRGVRQEIYSHFLRKADSIEHKTEDGLSSWHPAMVAKIVAPDGKPTNIHRTYLTLAGDKAGVNPVRKTMVGTIAKGSAVRLFEPGPVLGVAEGIETALAAAEIFRIPVWSAINSSLLSGWEPPPETHQVFVFADNDPKYGGLAAGAALAHRLACKGIDVRIEMPPVVGQDWNDVLLKQRGIAA